MRKRRWNSSHTSARRPLPQHSLSAWRVSCACGGLASRYRHSSPMYWKSVQRSATMSCQNSRAEKRSRSTTAPPPTSGAPLKGGGAVVLRERFSAREFWQDIVAERCTLFQYIGELCRYLLASPPQAQETRHALRLCCGNGLRSDVWEQFQKRFRIPQILEYYAATEGSFSLYNCEGRVGAIGRIPAFLAHRVPVALVRFDTEAGAPVRDEAGHCLRCAPDEVGEAIGALSRPGGQDGGRFEGYADPEASKQKILRDVFAEGDAWYRTGDLMRQDEQGFFYFVDRVGDTFRWKGENVSTGEVTAVR